MHFIDWVKVEDGLPEIGQGKNQHRMHYPFLVFRKVKNGCQRRFVICVFDNGKFKPTANQSGVFTHRDVTHWAMIHQPENYEGFTEKEIERLLFNPRE